MRTHLLSLCFALLVAAASAPPSQAASSPAAPRDARFGIAEGFRNPSVMADIGPGWERLVFSWSQIQPDRPGDFSQIGMTIRDEQLQTELNRGTRLAGLLQFTPDWAQQHPEQGERSVPKNLFLSPDDPSNYFADFVYHTVARYAGRIDDWIIWNEPDIQPGDQGSGGSYTWLGTDEEFAQLMKVAYLAAKRANPAATVSFPGTSYWSDELASPKRPQFYDRVLGLLAQDSTASAHNMYHDAVSVNLYRSPDDIYRVYGVFKDIQRAHGVDKPVWLTETNAMPTDDSTVACAERHLGGAIPTTMDQQAAYAIQAFALGAAAGYQRISFYQMVDGSTCSEPAVWGVTRNDGSRRPVADALKTAVQWMSGYTSATFAPRLRATEAWPAWPHDPTSYTPNWQTYVVSLDKPGQRVTVLWNGDSQPQTVQIPKTSTTARLVDLHGAVRSAQDNPSAWLVDLPAATAHFATDPAGYDFIGGDPLLLVEDTGTSAAGAPAPSVGQPTSSPSPVVGVDQVRAPTPDGPGGANGNLRIKPTLGTGQTVRAGQPAEFVLTAPTAGVAQPLGLGVQEWHTDRAPEPKDARSLPMRMSGATSLRPGDTGTIHLDTAGAQPGTYYVTIAATSGSTTATGLLILTLT